MVKPESKFVRSVKMAGTVSYKDYKKHLQKIGDIEEIKQLKYSLVTKVGIWNNFVKGTIYSLIATLIVATLGIFYRFYQEIIKKSSSLSPEEVTVLIQGAFLVCIVLIVFLLMVLLFITIKIIGAETRLQIINEYLEDIES